MDYCSVSRHYDLLIDEGNDPVNDPPALKEYMNKWDGDEFIKECCFTNEKTALEIGVGTGRLAVKTAPLCKSFYGIDISSKTVKAAMANLSEFDNVSIILGDFLEYELNMKFDILYSSLTFLHISKKQDAISKIASLLTAGSKICSFNR